MELGDSDADLERIMDNVQSNASTAFSFFSQVGLMLRLVAMVDIVGVAEDLFRHRG